MDETVRSEFCTLPAEVQALPIRAMPYFEPQRRRGQPAPPPVEDPENPPENYYDHYFVPYFDIPTVEEHARNTLSLMRNDKSTKESYIARLQRVNNLYRKDPSIGFLIANDAFLNAFQNDDSGSAMALRMLGATHREWDPFYEQARRVAVKAPRPGSTSTPHSTSSRGDEETELNKKKSSSNQGEKRRFTPEEQRSFNKGKRWGEKRARYAAHSKANSVVTGASQQPDSESVINSLKNLLGIGGSSGGGSSQTSSVQTKKNDRHEHNPKGKEHWFKWFRVCSNCRRWGAHFARSCQEQEHQDNKANPPNYSNPTPLNAYPKDFSQAMDLARSEKRKYGEDTKI